MTDRPEDTHPSDPLPPPPEPPPLPDEEPAETLGPAGWLPPEGAPPPVAPTPAVYPPPPAYPPLPPQPGYGPFGGYATSPVVSRRPRGPHGEPISGRWECAAWWPRVGAFLIDWAIVLIVPLAVGIPLIAAAGNGGEIAGTVVVLAGPPLLWGLYTAALMARAGARNGQTLGKQAAGIRVVRDGDQPLSFGYGLVRELAVRQVLFAVGSSLVFGIPYLLDYLWPLWDESNRTLHDMIVSSHVVREEPISA